MICSNSEFRRILHRKLVSEFLVEELQVQGPPPRPIVTFSGYVLLSMSVEGI